MGLNREQIIEKLETTTDLPAFPDIVLRLEGELRKEHPSIPDMARIVEQDPAISARVLRVANSAYYASSKETTEIQKALVRLGMSEARRIILAASLVTAFDSFSGVDFHRFWGHCLAVALTTRVIAQKASSHLTEEELDSSFSGGLLHDLGILALGHLFPTECEEMNGRIGRRGGSGWESEQKIWGIDHAQVGYVLAQKWKLPDPLVAVIAHHHAPWQADPAHRTLVQLVHLADFVCNNQGFGRPSSGFPAAFDEAAWEQLGLHLDDVDEIVAEVRNEGARSDVFLQAFSD